MYLEYDTIQFQIEIRAAVDPGDHIPPHYRQAQGPHGGRDGQDSTFVQALKCNDYVIRI